jgi:hypothetical protein
MYNKIYEIEKMLDQVPLDNLALLFSQENGSKYLFVYHTDSLPTMPDPNWQAKQLEQLKPSDYAEFDGLLVGYPALDVAFPDIPTHGSSFYHIEHIYDAKNRQISSQDTYQLAKWLHQHEPKFTNSRRGRSKIIELALPYLFQTINNFENLVAIIPNEDIDKFLNSQQDSLQTIYLDNENALSNLSGDEWLVALEEIHFLNDRLGQKRPFFSDLRLILRQSGHKKDLQNTCRYWSHDFWQKWQSSKNPDFKKTAYSLAAESWLMEEDVEDLIAILPHKNFWHFLQTGAAIRIYRSPRIYEKPNNPGKIYCSLSEFQRISKTDLDDYKTVPISFPALSTVFETITPEPVFDLGVVLYKAGKWPELAQTLSLLSMDLLKEPFGAGVSVNAKPQAITDLAFRAAMFYALEEPWHKQWHFRHAQLVEQSYQYLSECLLSQERSQPGDLLSDYYLALKEWYGCGISQDIPSSLNTIQDACHGFLEKSDKVTSLKNEQKIARRLMDAARILNASEVKSLRGTRSLPSHFDVIKYLRQVSDSSSPTDIFSLPFEDLLDAYEIRHNKWQTLQNNLSTQRPSEEDLRNLAAEYESLIRMAYAPAHELKSLQWACRQDMERIEHLRNALESKPMIKIRVLNPQVILDKQEHLHVEIENIGGAIAINFEINLNASRRFEFLSAPKPITKDKLEIGKPCRLTWDICCSESPLDLHFKGRFETSERKTSNLDERFQINAIRAKSAGSAPRGGNPYQAGPPVMANRFYGRDKEIKEILYLLRGGVTQPVLLRGARRIGKSSILRQLQYLLTHEGELQRINFSRDDEVTLQKIRPVLTSLQEISGANYIARWFQFIYMQICDSVGIPYSQEILEDEFNRFPYSAFAERIKYIFEQRPETRLLVMIDEWDEQLHLPELGPSLRAIMQNEDRINWIISSTWTLKAEMGRFASPFYGQAMAMELKEMDWSSASNLIIEPSKKIGVEWHGDAIVTLLEQTAQRPYLVQFLCQKIINSLYSQSSSVVDSDLVCSVINQFIKIPQTGGQPFSFLWQTVPLSHSSKEDVDLHWLGRLILLILDKLAPSELTYLEIRQAIQSELHKHKLFTPEDFFDDEFREQLIELENIFDAIVLKGQRYTFSIPLAKQWFHQTTASHPTPIQYAYAGMMQDYEEWKRASAKGNQND